MTNILSFDVESNGLQGNAFAVAGVLIDNRRQILSQFVARCPINDAVDPWVAENVIGPMASIADTHPGAPEMRRDFWQWYLDNKPKSELIVAANPYPVEARFLIDCQDDDMANRAFEHPFPFYDLSSMLYGAGVRTPLARKAYVAEAVATATGEPHNPLWDATATALTAHKLISSGISKVSASQEIIHLNSKASL
jgi:hypothetical protein